MVILVYRYFFTYICRNKKHRKMKKTFTIILLSTILFSCKSVEMYELSDGTLITKRKSDRISKRVIRQEFRKLSKEDKNLILLEK